MARPKKCTVDYFPHQIKDGKTLFILESKYGNNGYTFWFKLLEVLGKTEGHVYDTRNPADLMFLVAKTRVARETAIEILDILADLGAIDAKLWKNKIIWSQHFVDNIAEVYKKRQADVPQKPILSKQKPQTDDISGDGNPSTDDISGDGNPQTKLNKIKEIYMDFVYLTKDEYKKLQAEFGDDTQNKIGALNNYIGQIGEKAANKRYSSHYHTILTWDRNDKKKQFKNTPSQKKEKILDLNKYLREQDAIFGE